MVRCRQELLLTCWYRTGQHCSNPQSCHRQSPPSVARARCTLFRLHSLLAIAASQVSQSAIVSPRRSVKRISLSRRVSTTSAICAQRSVARSHHGRSVLVRSLRRVVIGGYRVLRPALRVAFSFFLRFSRALEVRLYCQSDNRVSIRSNDKRLLPHRTKWTIALRGS
jgi:hypothetical protein